MARARRDQLAPDQLFVQKRLLRFVRMATLADDAYDKLPDSRGGKIISVDIARLLAEEFQTWDGRVRHTPSTADAAGTYAHQRLLRELRRPANRRSLLITAGGAGSGKTTTLKLNDPRGSIIEDFDLVFDNQLRHFDRANEIMRTAHANRWKVSVTFVFRPFHEVVRAVAERSLRTGRWNYLYDLPAAHVEARETFLRLSEHYFAQVDFVVVVNQSTVGTPSQRARIVDHDVLRRGMRTNLSRDMLLHAYEEQVKRFLRQGPSQFSAPQAIQSNLKDFFALIGRRGQGGA